MPAPLPILIAGGGIGGLAAALSVTQAGREVRVLERSAGDSEAGAGIQLGPNAVKVLRALGLDEAMRAVATVPSALVVRHGLTGRILSEMQLGSSIEHRHGAPYWVAHRADLHAVLLAACKRDPRIGLRTGVGIENVANSDSSGVEIMCSDGTCAIGAALVGADGLWSKTRGWMHPGMTPVPSGYCAFRALIPVADAGELAAPVVGAWMAPRAHVVHYPVRGGREINVVVILPDRSVLDAWTAEASAAEVMSAVSALAPVVVRALAAAPGWHKWSLAQPVSLARWTQGSVALLGDAAHAMLPFFAQGGAMALEDAAVLGHCVGASPADLAGALACYVERRRARVARVQTASSANGRIFHLSGPAAVARDTILRFLPQQLLQARFDWLYGYDPTSVQDTGGAR